MINIKINELFSITYYEESNSIDINCEDISFEEIKIINEKGVNVLSFCFDYEDTKRLKKYLNRLIEE